MIDYLKHNACHNGLGEMAAFLRLFAKMVTAYPSPIAGTCYAFRNAASDLFTSALFINTLIGQHIFHVMRTAPFIER